MLTPTLPGDFHPVYDGSLINVSVIIKDGDKILVEGVDFELTGDYQNSTAGNHTAIIQYIGNYEGTFELPWTISPKGMDEVNITLPEITPVYNGSEIRVTVNVTNGDAPMIEGEDYRLGGDVNKTDAGTYNVTVEGIGNYNGTVNITWTIDKLDPVLSDILVGDMTFNYTGAPHKLMVTANESVYGLGYINVKYDGKETAPIEVGTYAVTVSINEGTNYKATTTDISLGYITINRVYVEEPKMPEIKPKEDGKVEIPKEGDNLDVTQTPHGDGTSTVSVTGITSGIVINITLDGVEEGMGDIVGKPSNTQVTYPELPSEHGKGVDKPDVKNPDSRYQINMTLTEATTNVPVINATLNKTVEDEFAKQGRELITMIAAEGEYAHSINDKIKDMYITFIIPQDWYHQMNAGVFWYHRADNGTVMEEERIYLPQEEVVRDGVNCYKVVIKAKTFSDYGVFGKRNEDPKPTPSPSHSGGSSQWLPSTATPVTNSTVNTTINSTINTTINETIPTETNPTGTTKTPVPIAGVMLGVIAGAAFMRTRMQRK